MELTCDYVMGPNSKLFDRRDNVLGAIYSRTFKMFTERKFQVVNRAGKHSNAVLCCLAWMKDNLKDFVEKRREFLNEQEKNTFFRAIFEVVHSTGCTLEMLQLLDSVKGKFCSQEVADATRADECFTRNIADILLVALSKNQQNIKAIAANSRKGQADAHPEPEQRESEDDDLYIQ